MRCVLIGNYGVANLGDEALKEYFLHAFASVDWIVLSANPREGEYPRLPGGIRSLFGTRWWKTVSAIRRSDAVVFGGGSLFTDVESVKACFLWAWHASLAFLCGKPVYLAFQGIGPYKTRIGERLARFVAQRSRHCSVRDGASLKRISNWHLNTKIVQTFDPVFSIMENKKSTKDTKKVFTVIPRHNSNSVFRQTVVEAITKTSGIEHVQILLMQPDSSEEQSVAEALRSSIGRPAELVSVRTLDELMQYVSLSSFVVTQRFHGALAALAAGVPQEIVAQGSGDKLGELRALIEHGFDAAQARTLVEDGRRSLAEALAKY